MRPWTCARDARNTYWKAPVVTGSLFKMPSTGKEVFFSSAQRPTSPWLSSLLLSPVRATWLHLQVLLTEMLYGSCCLGAQPRVHSEGYIASSYVHAWIRLALSSTPARSLDKSFALVCVAPTAEAGQNEKKWSQSLSWWPSCWGVRLWRQGSGTGLHGCKRIASLWLV